ncbi:MAG: decapping endonuclease targeting mRNA [Bathelium mastoideum]|nr:MAG: decapping endonuclease targeting mRNA [Bathelium mastoideum]
MADFRFTPLERFVGVGAAIKRPTEVTCFSFDKDHIYRQDDSSLQYYYPAQFGSDLSTGFDTFRQLDDSGDDHLDALLRAIVDLESKSGEKCEADVITWRGMMTKIMAVPYDNLNDFEMNATCFQGTISFIEENHAYKLSSRKEQDARPTRPGGPSQDLMAYWGYKFEALSLLPAPWGQTSREFIEAREDQVVDNHAQYCSVVRTGIGQRTMVLGGEVDGVWDSKPSDPSQGINWVELKTTAKPNNTSGGMLTYERKLLKYWIQSFLLGVPKIIVGFRDNRGILIGQEELDTRTIPGNVKRVGQSSWDGNVCINFTAAFLERWSLL